MESHKNSVYIVYMLYVFVNMFQMHPGVQYLNGAQHLNVNGQVGMATNWFPPPTQATGTDLLS